MKIGILGYGEIGQAIKQLYTDEILIKDIYKNINTFKTKMDIVHVCIPFDEEFMDSVKDMAIKYEPIVSIVHSTVPVGTTSRLSSYGNFVHSPVRGVHPNLVEGLKTFEKWIGYDGDDFDIADLVYNHFKGLGIKGRIMKPSSKTELAKLLDTTYYGAILAFHDYADRICKREMVDFGIAMTLWNESYNKGYTELGMKNVVRPTLYPPEGKIGGHCVIPNAKLLKEQYGDDLILDSILKLEP